MPNKMKQILFLLLFFDKLTILPEFGFPDTDNTDDVGSITIIILIITSFQFCGWLKISGTI